MDRHAISGQTGVRHAVVLGRLHGALRLGKLRRRNHLHRLFTPKFTFGSIPHPNINLYVQTFVIFSMLRTDLRRSSSSRSVAMPRAAFGAAASCGTRAAVRREDRASIEGATEVGEVDTSEHVGEHSCTLSNSDRRSPKRLTSTCLHQIISPLPHPRLPYADHSYQHG